MDGWRQDSRHGVRALLNARAFTAVALLSLAIGIGANSPIFSVANALILQPLPYPDASRIAIVWQRSPGLNVERDWLSLGQYLDVASENTTFERTAAAIGASFNLTGDGHPERVDGIRVTSSFFPLFGARAALGTLFTADDDRPGQRPAVILADGFWRRRFGANPDVLGKTLTLNGVPVRVAGVMARGFVFGKDVMPAVNGVQQVDLFLPLPMPPSARAKRDGEDYNLFAKLKPGVSRERAQAELDAIAARMRREYPASYPANGGLTLSVVPLLDQVVGDVRLALYVLLGAVGLVLAIACGNVANLLLSRSVRRERELAIRVAVGASRGRLVRQLMTENLILSTAGGAIGLAVGTGIVSTIKAFAGASVPRLDTVSIDGRVLAFTALTSLVTGLVFGVVPALRASGVDPHIVLKDARHGSGGHARLRRVLVAGEVALSLVLLVGAVLLMRSYGHITNASPGFDPRNVLSFRVTLPASRYKSADDVFNFYDALGRRLRALPGVDAVGSNYQLPLSTVAYAWEPIGVEGYVPKTPGSDVIISSSAYVSADYFKAMGVPVAGGRAFTAADDQHAPPVAIVNRGLADRFWPGESAIGKRIRQGADGPWRTVVGVVNDAKDYQTEAQPPITTYFPVEQFRIGSRFVVVRALPSVSAQSLTSAALRELRAIDPDLPAYDVSTMEARLHDSFARRRLAMVLLASFAGLAMVLAAIGIYGVIAYWIGERTPEIGIRVALGADRARILRLVGRELGGVVGLGVVAGVGGALLTTRVMAGLLFGVTATDPATFVVVAAGVTLVAVAAAWLPARRAMRVEPVVALKTR